MTKRNAVLLTSTDELLVVLHRMTTREMRALVSDTGETDLRDCAHLLRFSHLRITSEIGGCQTNVKQIIEQSGLEYIHQGSTVMVWLDDLDERLERLFKQSNK